MNTKRFSIKTIAFFCLALCLTLSVGFAQKVTIPSDYKSKTPDARFTTTEVSELPEYIEGKAQLPLFVLQEAKYPSELLKNKIEGVVVVEITIEKDGSITNPKVVGSIHPKLDQEALRVVSKLKSFIPAKLNGEIVRCIYPIPVPFLLKK